MKPYEYEEISLMNMKTLREVMFEIADNCPDSSFHIESDMSYEDILRKEVNKLATKEVLDYINNHMKSQPMVDLKIKGTDYIEMVERDEENIGHEVEYVPKLFDEPACLLGEDWTVGNGAGSLFYIRSLYMFVTASGEFRFAYGDTIYQPYFDSDDKFMELTVYKETTDEYYGLERLQDILPDEYGGVLYCYN